MRVVLHVAVHEDQDLATAVVDPCLDGGRLAEVAAEADHAHMRVVQRELRHLLGAAVAAAVIYVDDLVRHVQGLEDPAQLFLQGLDAVDFVVNEDDHRQPWLRLHAPYTRRPHRCRL